jgi:excisionase family DNA binding protein
MISSPAIDTILTPNPQDQKLAQVGRGVLAAASQHDQAARLTIAESSTGNRGGEITLSPSVVRILSRVFDELAQGHAVTVLPLDEELTTQEAADLLHVSRPYFVTLLDQGELSFRKVGNQRRVRLREVIAYKQQQYERSTRTMQDIADLSDEMGLYD